MEMHNYMEDIISDRMETILKTMPDVCKCERCKLDRLALALNNMKPKYIVSSKGRLYAKISQLQGQFDVDIVRVITDAIVRIDQSPRHNEDE
jgi:competence protein ComFB